MSDSPPPRVAFLVAEFNKPLTAAMLSAAQDQALRAGAEVVATVTVPGCYELPLLAKRLVARNDVDALIVLGYIERGDTLHGEVMGNVVHRSLVELSLAHEKPLGLGIIGPGATSEQAEARKDA